LAFARPSTPIERVSADSSAGVILGRMGLSFAKVVVLAGLLLAALGALLWLGHVLPWLRLGRLPGDLRIEREGFALYFPITTMILLSLLATVVLWLLRR
jgi:hypothetical protein